MEILHFHSWKNFLGFIAFLLKISLAITLSSSAICLWMLHGLESISRVQKKMNK